VDRGVVPPNPQSKINKSEILNFESCFPKSNIFIWESIGKPNKVTATTTRKPTVATTSKPRTTRREPLALEHVERKKKERREGGRKK
jgi:hypothetical protein